MNQIENKPSQLGSKLISHIDRRGDFDRRAYERAETDRRVNRANFDASIDWSQFLPKNEEAVEQAH